MADPRDTGGVSARPDWSDVPPPPRRTKPVVEGPEQYLPPEAVEPEPRLRSVPEPKTAPEPEPETESDPETDREVERGPVVKKAAARPAKKKKAASKSAAKRGRGWKATHGKQWPFRVRIPVEHRDLLKADAARSGRSHGIIAYAAVADHLSAIRAELAPSQAPDGMPAPRRGRFYTDGGAPKVDLYLSEEERDAINALADDIGTTPSELFRAALRFWASTQN